MKANNQMAIHGAKLINVLLMAAFSVVLFFAITSYPVEQPTSPQPIESITSEQLSATAEKVDTPLIDAITRFGYNNAIQVLFSLKEANPKLDYYLYRYQKEQLQLISKTAKDTVESLLEDKIIEDNKQIIVFKRLNQGDQLIGMLVIKYYKPEIAPQEQAQPSSMTMFLIYAAIASLLFIAIVIFIPSQVTKTIRRNTKELENEVHLIKEKEDFGLRVSTQLGFGLRHIAESINSLLQRVEKSEKLHIEAENELQALQNSLEAQVHTRTSELEKAIKVAEQASEAKTTFLATMSHEIRTPMNGVIGTIDLLRHTELNSSQHRLTSIIRESAFSLLGILDDILDFSKIEAGKLSIEQKPFSIIGVAEEVARVMASIASKKNLHLSLYIDPEIPDFLLGDTVRVRQVIYNLCSNAIKFTKTDESVQGKVTISLRLANRTHDFNTIEIKITDNGKGMTKEQLAKIFNPFSQAEDSITREYGGTGLGLSICKSLTELMYGQIKVSSEPGLGSEFTITLPLTLTEQSRAENKARLKNYKVALVSKEPDNKAKLMNYLRFLSAEIIEFDNYNEAEQPWLDTPNLIWVLDSTSDSGFIEQTLTRIGKNLETKRQQAIILSKQSDAKLSYPNLFYLSAYPLSKSSFFNALLVAAGLHKPKEIKAQKVNLSYPSIEQARAQNRLILLVEDNVMNQQVITDQLHLLGYAVEVADDGEIGFEMWEKGNYPLVLTDLHMPKVSGYDLAKRIRQTGAYRDDMEKQSVIVAITANALKGEREKCISLGMNDYITKPVELNVLEQIVNKWLPIQEPEATAEVPISLSQLQEYVGTDSEKQKHYLNLFLEHGGTLVRDIKQAMHNDMPETVAEFAHQLKSTARTVGANNLATIAERIEETIRQGVTLSASDLVRNIDSLEQSFFNVREYIKQMRHSQSL